MKAKIFNIESAPALIIILLILINMAFSSTSTSAKGFYIGTACADITPEIPVALVGQFPMRIADTIETPLTANVIALELYDDKQSVDVAIMVSCDLLYISNEMLGLVRSKVKESIPDLDISKIILNATHTHTAPVLENDSNSDFSFRYPVPEKGVLQVDDYIVFFVQQVSDAIVRAWRQRSPGSVTWGLSHAVIGYNRRIVYSKEQLHPGRFDNRKAQTYGNTSVPDFMNIEGSEDHAINTLYFWDENNNLIALGINIPCPSQVVESRSTINADYWHPLRERLRYRFGKDLTILGWGGAAGDLSPRPMYRKAAEERMVRLRDINQTDEIARRVCLAVEEAYETVKNDRYQDVELKHISKKLQLPMRKIKVEEYEFAKSERDEYTKMISENPEASKDILSPMTWNEDVVKRFELQEEHVNSTYETEIHVLRLGDIAICTNQFELFTDYGIQIQARSNALQTFIITYAGPITYLPTEKAIEGGGYSAIVQSGVVGSEGGKILVDETVSLINSLWEIE